MTLTKLVFLAVIAVLAAVLYTLPAHAKGPGDKEQSGNTPAHGMNATPAATPDPSDKAKENSNGQFQQERKFGQDRASQRKSEKSKVVTPPAAGESKKPAQ